MQIHINRDGQNFGPYSLDEVRQYVASGNIVLTDLAWYEGAPGWMPLGQVPGVGPAARPAAAAVAPAAAAAQREAVPHHAATASTAGAGTSHGGFWKRVVAYLIDGLLVGIVTSLLGGLLMAGVIGAIGSGSPEAAGAGLGFITLIYFGSMIMVWLYFALMESSAAQATLGKMALGMVVSDIDGNRIGFARATGRFFGKILSSLVFGLGFLMVGLTARKQGLHDMLASTLVVNKDPANTRVPWWGWVLLVVFFVLPFLLGMLGALAIPAYSDYTERAKAAAMLNEASAAKIAMTEFVLSNDRLPESFDELGIGSESAGAYLSLERGVLVLTSMETGNTLGLEPYRSGSGQLSWRCGNAAPPAGADDIADGDASDYTTLAPRALPASCR